MLVQQLELAALALPPAVWHPFQDMDGSDCAS
jgi:hypothetical protein